MNAAVDGIYRNSYRQMGADRPVGYQNHFNIISTRNKLDAITYQNQNASFVEFVDYWILYDFGISELCIKRNDIKLWNITLTSLQKWLSIRMAETCQVNKNIAVWQDEFSNYLLLLCWHCMGLYVAIF